MPTKWYEQNHKNEAMRTRYTDTPIPIGAAREEREDKPMCPYCWCHAVVKEEFNDRCTRTSCGHIFNIKRPDKGVEPGIIVENDNVEDNVETLVSHLPDANDDYYRKSEPEYHGTFKAMTDRGIHITSYTETSGDGKVIRSYSDTSNSTPDSQRRSAPRPFKESRSEE